MIEPPSLGGVALTAPWAWYYVLLACARRSRCCSASTCCAPRPGAPGGPSRRREAVAEALGINVPAYKVLAFMVSSTMTAVAGALFAYYRSFVSAEAFSLFLTIQYVAMVIIGGMGSIWAPCWARCS